MRIHTVLLRVRLTGVLLLLALFTACGRSPGEPWQLTSIEGFFPDLQFTLSNGGEHPVTAKDFRGKVVLLYFGYLNCPDVCPMTMSRLGSALKELGERADAVRVLFVSVDPRRDTPQQLATYARAFSEQGVGATGTPAEIEAMAKRYRVAYEAEAPDAGGNYEVMHGKAVYVFDGTGRARLMITDSDSPEAIAHDLRQLIATSS